MKSDLYSRMEMTKVSDEQTYFDLEYELQFTNGYREYEDFDDYGTETT